MTKSLSLYTISTELETILDNGIDEDGVISEELGDMLAKFEDKGKAVAAYILNQDATADAIDEAIKKLEKRAVAYKKKSETLRTYLQDNMKRANIMQISADDGTFSVKLFLERDPSVEIFNEGQIPNAYMTKPSMPEAKPMKKEIGDAIKAGIDVPGARIVKSDRLSIK